MKVDFKCPTCESVQEVVFPIAAGPPKEVLCTCGKHMTRIYGKPTVQIPDYFVDQDFNALRSHMANAPRPSGKTQLYY